MIGYAASLSLYLSEVRTGERELLCVTVMKDGWHKRGAAVGLRSEEIMVSIRAKSSEHLFKSFAFQYTLADISSVFPVLVRDFFLSYDELHAKHLWKCLN